MHTQWPQSLHPYPPETKNKPQWPCPTEAITIGAGHSLSFVPYFTTTQLLTSELYGLLAQRATFCIMDIYMYILGLIRAYINTLRDS